MNEQEIIYKKVGEWEEKGSRQKLKTRIENWLSQFNGEERVEMLCLLLNFDYFSHNKLTRKVVELYDRFTQKCCNKDVVFTKIDKEVGVGFSSIFYSCFWQNNNLYDYAEESIAKFDVIDILPNNVIIVDDFFGSGNTFINYLKKLINLNSNIKTHHLYFLALQGTFIGKHNIEEFAKKENLNLTIIVNKISKKAYEAGFIFNNVNVEIHKDIYFNACSKRNIKYEFGFEEIEALISFYYNSPNNTLGAFWYDINEYKALFSRFKKQRTSLTEMQQKVKSNNYLKHQKPFINDVDSYRNDIFMVYCLSKGKEFDLYEACYDFGLTEKQITSMLEYLCKEGFLFVTNSKYQPTDKLKEYLFSTRIKSFKKMYSEVEKDNKIELKETTYIPKDFSKRFKGYKN